MSAGFHRMGANVPGKLQGFSNRAMGGLAIKLGPSAEPTAPTVDPAHPETELKPPEHKPNMRAIAIQQGYTGDSCSTCGGTRMKVSGHCMVCDDCGTTTGCS